ncbi:MAG TPA: copper resistance protein CopC, partial [Actinomycetota bacterium]
MLARRRGLPLRLIRCVALLAALGLALLMGPGAAAHALVASSDPADGATLASSPSQIVITFTEQP